MRHSDMDLWNVSRLVQGVLGQDDELSNVARFREVVLGPMNLGKGVGAGYDRTDGTSPRMLNQLAELRRSVHRRADDAALSQVEGAEIQGYHWAGDRTRYHQSTFIAKRG